MICNTIDEAVASLSDGAVIAYPTETYYGLGVDIYNERALNRLFHVKKRQHSKPILVLIHSVDQLTSLTPAVPDLYKPLIEKHWPGPLTLIFQARNSIPELLTGSTGTIGVRLSSCKTARDLCVAWEKPLTATSANISGSSPAETVKEVQSNFGEQLGCILPESCQMIGQGSTLVTIEKKSIKVLRQGPVFLN